MLYRLFKGLSISQQFKLFSFFAQRTKLHSKSSFTSSRRKRSTKPTQTQSCLLLLHLKLIFAIKWLCCIFFSLSWLSSCRLAKNTKNKKKLPLKINPSNNCFIDLTLSTTLVFLTFLGATQATTKWVFGKAVWRRF